RPSYRRPAPATDVGSRRVSWEPAGNWPPRSKLGRSCLYASSEGARMRLVPIVFLLTTLPGATSGQGNSGPLSRTYHEGEKSAYHMTATNLDIHRDLAYEADAVCAISKTANGVFVEDFEWTRLVVNGQPIQLPQGAAAIHQLLSREPGYRMGVPDLSKVPR